MASRVSRSLKWFFLNAVGTILLGSAAVAAPGAGHPERPLDHVPSELVVKFRADASSRAGETVVTQALQGRLGRQAVVGFRTFVTDPTLAVVKLKSDLLVNQAITVLKGEATVAYSEPNFIYHAFATRSDAPALPGDPDFSKSWNLYNVGQADSSGQVGVPGADINLMPLWQKGITGSKKVVVAVIDTGIQWDHPDLVGNLYVNSAEIAGNGKDDDGNGFIDDIHGWNFSANNNDSNDDNEHGSHCAGVIGATGGNGIGTAGVNWNVSLLPVKFLNGSGSGTLENAVNSINYAKMMKVNVMSNSWGGGGFSQAIYDAIKSAKDQGILFVAAAGNDGTTNDDHASTTYPAGFDLPNIVAVAATDNRNTLASFSNFGIRSVHVAAPGVNIYSTVKGGKWDTFSGTSMATPHVAGVSALLLSENPAWTYEFIKDRLIKTSTPSQSLRRKVVSGGVINAYNAFYGIVPPNEDPDEHLWKDAPQVIETAHPYTDKLDVKYPVKVDGAKYIRVHFEKIETEANYDVITIEKPTGEVVEQISGAYTAYDSEYVKGDSLVIHFKTDVSVAKWGFKVDKAQFIAENSSSR